MTKEGIFISTITIIALIAISYTIGSHRWNLNQEFFPCNEDEVLGYSYTDNNRVVCIHIDQLTSLK